MAVEEDEGEEDKGVRKKWKKKKVINILWLHSGRRQWVNMVFNRAKVKPCIRNWPDSNGRHHFSLLETLK